MIKKKTTKRKTKVAKGISLPRGKEEKLREKKGGSSTGRYKNVPKKDFAGKAGGTSPYSFPIHDIAHARNALARAHFAPDPEGIRAKVYKKYPELKKHKLAREGKSTLKKHKLAREGKSTLKKHKLAREGKSTRKK